MGCSVSVGGGKELKARALMVGLDSTGKSVLLYRMIFGEEVVPIPTIGFNLETLQHENVTFTVWDAGGQAKIRPLWRHYYHETDALIFVLDASDRERIEGEGGVLFELTRLMEEEVLKDAVVLLLANKRDLPQSMGLAEITERLKLQQLMRGRTWRLFECSAKTGEGLENSFTWLAHKIRFKNNTTP